MFSLMTLAVLGLAYLLLLFAVAFWGDRLPVRRIGSVKPLLLALAGTYTSAWMFFGTPAQAVEDGWLLPPTFVGATLMLAFGAPLLRRFVKLTKQQGCTSIADFISAQYGGSQLLAAVVAAVALVAVLPYLALQLRAISDSFLLLTDASVSFTPTITLVIGVTLGLFALMFGTRNIDSGAHRNGMLMAVALEALIKILAFVAVGYYATHLLFDGPWDLARSALNSERLQLLAASRPADTGFFATIVLGMAAMFCLPRQFHILMIESDSDKDIHTLRKLIPFYLGILTLFIAPVGYAGYLWLPAHYDNPERFVLALPLESGNPGLALLAFIGGLSAGASMIIVATIALSTMIANTMVVPWWLQRAQQTPQQAPQQALGHNLRRVRRVIIAGIMGCALLVNASMGAEVRLGTFGLLSLVLVAQLAPAMIASLYWRRARAEGVVAGLLAGTAVWTVSPLANALGYPDLLGRALGFSALTIGCVLGLGLNTLLLWCVSQWYNHHSTTTAARDESPGQLDKNALFRLLARFIGADAAHKTFAGVKNRQTGDKALFTPYRDITEKVLAGIVGSSSAQRLLRELGSAKAPAIDAASEIYRFGRSLLQSSIDNIEQGISVIDGNLNLVAWNRRYLALFHYPGPLIYVGQPVAELVRYNAERGECGPGAVEEHVRKRVAHLRRGTAYKVRRYRRDGTVLEIRGMPLPEGGFVTTYTDISDYAHAVRELEDIRNSLEQKVSQRTAEIERVNRDLQEAMASKTRFLASASHDLVQPLNASRLFLDALAGHDLDSDSRTLVHRTDDALHAAERLITDMLQLARMDAGDIKPQLQPLALSSILDVAVAEARLQLRQKAGPTLQLRYRPSSYWVASDPNMLRRVVQNLLENAIKYTRHGGILIGCRTRGDHLCLEIWDTGVGIAPEQQNAIFEEFTRLGGASEGHGYGLGLATVKRLCHLLKTPLALRSRVGHGSVFRLSLTRTGVLPGPPAVAVTGPGAAQPIHLQVLCIDNEPRVLQAMQALLQGWGCAIRVSTGRQTRDLTLPDVMLMDYHLDDATNGIALARQLFVQWGGGCPCIVISAENTDQVRTRAQHAGFYFLQKPIRPAALRALLSSIAQQSIPTKVE
ncbi:PAS domain-containing hybrid sensor histidine kinase/response regulator [Microbulbifer spongiae]|uniref:histidine kinase n=1 Tax=Microbulbifer spongiae TaxID=2944933 RepID=A0ABY9E5H7_9GAMM|nr:PAS-domain containing protein [Microbulbifer sp. MI-G]WKD48270.1 hybrid sensor histidine kinase/response regulator [Microbulbifer sp. MI-G]